MDASSNFGFLRPRAVVAVVAATAAVSVGLGILIEHVRQQRWQARADEAALAAGGGLHRRNAVRRTRHHGQADGGETNGIITPTDENADVNNLHGVVGGGDEGEAAAETMGDEDGTVDERWLDDITQAASQRAGQNIVSLLFRVSEDNARRSAYVHRGCACNACGIVPIRGIRYRCANCADFDLCETCEAQGMHIKTHIFYKVKVPAPPFGPRQMQPVWYPGDPETCLRSLPRDLMVQLSRETGFERQELEAFWEQWTYMANTEWRDDPSDLGVAMDRKTFERCLVPSGGYRLAAPNLIHDRMFAFYDTNNDDLIGFSEFLHGLSYRKRKDKLRKVFDGYDTDRDGLVNRRDFLRFFRAYYVLYKQMHKDILEGLDDQIMGSIETHQLVSNRQPLSSLFGREGRVPEADLQRVLEGKTANAATGDVTVADGVPGAVGADKNDTANREDILASLFMRPDRQRRRHRHQANTSASPHHDGEADTVGGRHATEQPEETHQYWAALLSPPMSLQDVSTLLIGRRDSSVLAEGIFVVNADEGGETHWSGEDDETPSSTEPGPPPAAPSGQHALTVGQLRAQQEGYQREQAAKKAKLAARKKLHERWLRRQFYLDEEEGAVAPEGWQDEEDVLVREEALHDDVQHLQAQADDSRRSRSSSKVRFAEDTEDYEVRSNPSTSSRSVPERWGGMEIPDAERDAGREILYQVMQQAFNELLDILFKEKENLAVAAAQTKSARDKYRHLFASIDLEAAEERASSNSGTNTTNNNNNNKQASSNAIGEQSLEELLARSGYQIVEQQEEIVEEDDEEEDEEDEEDENENDEGEESEESEEAQLETELGRPWLDEQHDPTMPQFRPNSEAEAAAAQAAAQVQAQSLAAASTAATVATSSDDDKPRERGKQGKHRKHRKQGKQGKRGSTPVPIPHSLLVEWKRLDVAEQEARERHGWGKLTYGEFETIFKAEEAASNRLDYLGSWIDFCIP